MEFLIALLWPILAGTGAWWFAGKVRGRNMQKALRFTAFGFWSLLLRFVLPYVLPVGALIGWPVAIFISICFFLAAGNSVLKEMRAQQRGDYTERAM